MLKIKNCKFNDVTAAIGQTGKQALLLDGDEDILVEGCEFASTGYSAILNKCTGNVTVKDCVFDSTKVKNTIEGSTQVTNGNLLVKNCSMNGAGKNNYVNVYKVKDNAKIQVLGCNFSGNADKNIIRISNANNSTITVDFEDSTYTYDESAAISEYSNAVLFQDYGAAKGNPQDFTKVTLNITNVQKPAESGWYYVYQDGAGIIDTNQPTVIVDGQKIA